MDIILLPKDCRPLVGGLQSFNERINKNTKFPQKVLGFKIIKVTLQHETEYINLK